MKTLSTHNREGRISMKANLKRAIMATAVFGMLAGPYVVSEADAICLISCSRRSNTATTTNQSETNSVWGSYRGHQLDTYSSQYQSGDITVGNFGNGNVVAGGPEVLLRGDNNGSVNASQSNNFGIVNSNFGHSAAVAPQASGDVSASIFPMNDASSRNSIPISQGDTDTVNTKVK